MIFPHASKSLTAGNLSSMGRKLLFHADGTHWLWEERNEYVRILLLYEYGRSSQIPVADNPENRAIIVL